MVHPYCVEHRGNDLEGVLAQAVCSEGPCLSVLKVLSVLFLANQPCQELMVVIQGGRYVT
jgi:hypothetical protein